MAMPTPMDGPTSCVICLAMASDTANASLISAIFKYLKSLQDIRQSLDQVPKDANEALNDNGKRSSAWVAAARVRQGAPPKKQKRNDAYFKMIISHTLHIELQKTYTSTDLDLESVPKALRVSFDHDAAEGCLWIMYGQVKLGRLDESKLRWLAASASLAEKGAAFIDATMHSKAKVRDGGHIGRHRSFFHEEPHDIKFEILVKVSIDVDQLARSWHEFVPLLIHAFLRHHEGSPIAAIERLSGLSYRETNLDWFYACLNRPGNNFTEPLPKDRKGKGRAVKQEEGMEDSLQIGGLDPTLFVHICVRVPALADLSR